MKKIIAFAVLGVLAAAGAKAFQLPGIPKAPGTSSGPTAAPAGVPTGGGGGEATIKALDQCCDEVRFGGSNKSYSDANTKKVSRATAEAKMKSCTGSGWAFSKRGSETKWYQKNWGGDPDGCLTVQLSCDEAGTYCDSCTVVPSSGMRSYCEPFK